jgi:hypothetical protein
MTWQPGAVLYPDIELWGTGYLRAALATREEAYAQSVWVDHRRPSLEDVTKAGLLPYPQRMVVLRRDGGRAANLRDTARLSARVYVSKGVRGADQQANDLARLVVALMSAAATGAPVLRVEHQSGPVPVPDESGPLMYLLFEIATRGEPLAV